MTSAQDIAKALLDDIDPDEVEQIANTPRNTFEPFVNTQDDDTQTLDLYLPGGGDFVARFLRDGPDDNWTLDYVYPQYFDDKLDAAVAASTQAWDNEYAVMAFFGPFVLADGPVSEDFHPDEVEAIAGTPIPVHLTFDGPSDLNAPDAVWIEFDSSLWNNYEEVAVLVSCHGDHSRMWKLADCYWTSFKPELRSVCELGKKFASAKDIIEFFTPYALKSTIEQQESIDPDEVEDVASNSLQDLRVEVDDDDEKYGPIPRFISVYHKNRTNPVAVLLKGTSGLISIFRSDVDAFGPNNDEFEKAINKRNGNFSDIHEVLWLIRMFLHRPIGESFDPDEVENIADTPRPRGFYLVNDGEYSISAFRQGEPRVLVAAWESMHDRWRLKYVNSWILDVDKIRKDWDRGWFQQKDMIKFLEDTVRDSVDESEDFHPDEIEQVAQSTGPLSSFQPIKNAYGATVSWEKYIGKATGWIGSDMEVRLVVQKYAKHDSSPKAYRITMWCGDQRLTWDWSSYDDIGLAINRVMYYSRNVRDLRFHESELPAGESQELDPDEVEQIASRGLDPDFQVVPDGEQGSYSSAEFRGFHLVYKGDAGGATSTFVGYLKIHDNSPKFQVVAIKDLSGTTWDGVFKPGYLRVRSMFFDTQGEATDWMWKAYFSVNLQKHDRHIGEGKEFHPDEVEQMAKGRVRNYVVFYLDNLSVKFKEIEAVNVNDAARKWKETYPNAHIMRIEPFYREI